MTSSVLETVRLEHDQIKLGSYLNTFLDHALILPALRNHRYTVLWIGLLVLVAGSRMWTGAG